MKKASLLFVCLFIIAAGLAAYGCETTDTSGETTVGSPPSVDTVTLGDSVSTQVQQPTATPTPLPTSTPEPTLTPTATRIPAPTRTPIPTPTPSPLDGYSTQNTRWLKQVHPTLYRRLERLEWAQDGLSELERDAIDQLLYLGADSISNLEAVLSLAWVRDDITSTKRDALKWIGSIGNESKRVANSIIGMPFLESLESDDVLAIRGLYRLARSSDDGLLSALLDDPALNTGITDAQITLVAAAGAMQNAEEIRRLLIPKYAYIKTVSSGTELSPTLRITIVRFETPGQPWTFGVIRDAVEFTETIMQRPLPVDHVILVMNEQAVLEDFAGVNFGFAISGLPGLEEGGRDYDKYRLSSLILHEIAHYFWRAHADWIDEGVANTFEFMHGVEIGMSPGLLQTPSRNHCAAHNLQLLTKQAPSQQDPQFSCNYFLGQTLFLDLLENQGVEDFGQRLRELYRLSLAEKSGRRESGIGAVRQAFPEHADIVEKHWSGKLNVPETAPFDEGIDSLSHGLIQWDQYPTYDGHSVTFRGTLLDDASLAKETIENARRGGFQNFTLHKTRGISFVGSILPALNDDRDWQLDDLGDAIATEYLLEGKTFIIEFPLPQSFRNPSDYAVFVWGYMDESRRPFINTSVDPLGYARIRADE